MDTGKVLSSDQARDLEAKGFLVVPGPVPREDLELLSSAYDRAMREADPADSSTGSTTTRVHDFVNRGAEFDRLYLHSPVLEACSLTLRQPFRLSSLLGRTLLPNAPAQALHVDDPPDENGWTMLGYIYMIDEFRGENGATCFVPGTHLASSTPVERTPVVPACGPAGSVIIYNGSVLHGHGANLTGQPRRSVQGAYIRRDAHPATDFASRMRPETLSRISPLARCLLGLTPGNCEVGPPSSSTGPKPGSSPEGLTPQSPERRRPYSWQIRRPRACFHVCHPKVIGSVVKVPKASAKTFVKMDLQELRDIGLGNAFVRVGSLRIRFNVT